jgi:hypothetical protein
MTTAIYEHHVLAVAPGALSTSLDTVRTIGREKLAASGGRLFGAWKPLIGLSLNHVVIVTEWPDEKAARQNLNAVLSGLAPHTVEQHDLWLPTLRPGPGATPPTTPGYVTHRWYDIRADGLDRFLDLTRQTWSNWEGTHDGEVLGLWRTLAEPRPGIIRMRLMAWYKDMSVWENSRHWKGTKGAETANQNLGQRYDMTIDSAVSILQHDG